MMIIFRLYSVSVVAVDVQLRQSRGQQHALYYQAQQRNIDAIVTRTHVRTHAPSAGAPACSHVEYIVRRWIVRWQH